MRMLRRFLLPDILLVAAGLAATLLPTLSRPAADAAPLILLVTVAVGVLLGLRFHRGRQLMLLLLVGALPIALLAPANPDSVLLGAAAAALLLPLIVAAIALLPERGALTSAGITRLGALALAGTAAAALVQVAPATVHQVLALPLRWPVAALGLLALLIVWLRDPSPVASGMFWALVMCLVALDLWPAARATTAFATAAIILSVSVVESSYALAFQDGLTGLPGRRALAEALHEPGERYTVAMVDVDHFKLVNDRWGHDVGDQILRMVAARLDKTGGGGRAFRYGGEEFAVLFRGISAEQARPHLEALRASVEQSHFVIRHRPRLRKSKESRGKKAKGTTVHATVSIGIAEGGAAAAPMEVLKVADKMLYRAKEAGRNRVEG